MIAASAIEPSTYSQAPTRPGKETIRLEPIREHDPRLAEHCRLLSRFLMFCALESAANRGRRLYSGSSIVDHTLRMSALTATLKRGLR